MPLAKLKAAAYIRVSTAMQVDEGSSLTEQRETLTKRIEAEGWELADVYADEGISGKRDDRPELERLLRDLPKLDRIVVTELSRLGRRAKGMLDLFDKLAADNVALVSIRQSIDTSTAAGRLLRNVLVSVAEFESEQLGERVAAVNRSRTAAGIHHGRAPYGYRNKGADLVQIPEQAAVVKRIFKAADAGTGQRIIARELNAECIKPQKAKQWSQSSVARILANPTYKGLVEINGNVYPGTHKRIVTPALWDRVETLRIKSMRTRNGGPGRLPVGPHLFTRGLLRHECGATMTPRTHREKGGTREVYTCLRHIEDGDAGCDLQPVAREAIDTAALDYFQRAALDADTMRAELDTAMSERRELIAGQVSDAEREAATAAERMQRVRAAFQDGALEADDYREQFAELSEAQKAAGARADLAREREAEFIAAESSEDDPVEAAAERMKAIREAVAGRLSDENGINAVRAALTDMFESFTLMSVRAGDDLPADLLPGESEAAERVREQARVGLAAQGIEAIPAESFVIWPNPKREVVEGLDEALMPVLRRRGIAPDNKERKGFWT